MGDVPVRDRHPSLGCLSLSLFSVAAALPDQTHTLAVPGDAPTALLKVLMLQFCQQHTSAQREREALTSTLKCELPKDPA
jgi:hypothetical protein